jgi:polysaccharide export outer membrane protein
VRFRTLFLCVLGLLVAVSTAFPQDRLPVAVPGTTTNLPARPIGPNDLLAVTVYGAPELTRTVRVSARGDIRLPMLHERIRAEGVMPAQLEDRIAHVLDSEKILVDPAVTVNIAEYYTQPISVAGAVRVPLTFQVYQKITLLEALTRAQGLSDDAGPYILVTRPPGNSGGEPQIQRIPVKGLIDRADPSLNLVLNGGEEVRVPPVGRVFVVGNVRQPGAFSLGDNAGMTVLKALALAQGLTRFSAKEAYIYRRPDRIPAAAARELPVPLRKILDRKASDVALDANDILYIPDNRRARLTSSALEKIVAFASGTASGALVYSAARP